MRLSHPDYGKLVFRTYQLLRSTPEFPSALKQPTPASIRKECLIVYEERPDKKDEPILRSFFGPADENKSYLTPIENFQTDGFRAFTNYLKGRSSKTDDKNVELLAWLINFSHRPYRYDMEVILSENEKAILNTDEVNGESIQNGIEENNSERVLVEPQGIEMGHNATPIVEVEGFSKSPKSDTSTEIWNYIKKKKWLFIGIPIFLVILSSGAYLLYNKSENCMYWAGDHYEQIDCDANINNKILLNEDRLKNFKKITRPDTLTTWSIGKVYYLKNNGALEYFTAAGNHPVFVTRYLRKLSAYMYEIYVRKISVNLDTSAKSQTTNLTNR